MRKTLQDVAVYLKEILVPETFDSYPIKLIYSDRFSVESIRDGISAFRTFLVHLYDELSVKDEKYDTCKKVAHEYENRTTLSVYYPFLHNVSTILMRIGYFGTYDEDNQCLLCNGNIFNKKLSVPKTLECLRFLVDCGLSFEGLDLNDKKQNIYEIQNIKVSYLESPKMFLGMKTLAIAEMDHGTLVNQDVFLRCDYNAIKEKELDPSSILANTIMPLSPEVQAFTLGLHQWFQDKGLNCIVEVKGFHIYIKYSYKRKDIWGINSSLNNGYHINMKSSNISNHLEVLDDFPKELQELVFKGFGCGRKREIGRCDGGCRGIPIALDNSILEIRDAVEKWFEIEMSYLK